MAEKTSAFIESSRTRARAIKARHEELGTPIPLAQAYELLAAADGHRTWAAMRAAGEAQTVPMPMEIHEDEQGWLFSIRMVRRISLDAHDTNGEFLVPQILQAAHADLSYVLLDGEEHPAMRFRDTERTGADEYAVTVDIEGSHRKDIPWHGDRLRLAENIIRFEITRYSGDHADSDAIFDGSGHSPSESCRWRDLLPVHPA